jgi:hypothetical protein
MGVGVEVGGRRLAVAAIVVVGEVEALSSRALVALQEVIPPPLSRVSAAVGVVGIPRALMVTWAVLSISMVISVVHWI